MVVRIRLALYGRQNKPYFRIMVADSRRARDGKFIEHIGAYDPIVDANGFKQLRLNTERVRHWIAVGAQPSRTVARLLEKANILPPQPRRNTLRALPDDFAALTGYLAPNAATNALPVGVEGQPSIPVSHEHWWSMLRGRQVPGLGPVNDPAIQSPLSSEIQVPVPGQVYAKQGVAVPFRAQRPSPSAYATPSPPAPRFPVLFEPTNSGPPEESIDDDDDSNVSDESSSLVSSLASLSPSVPAPAPSTPPPTTTTTTTL